MNLRKSFALAALIAGVIAVAASCHPKPSVAKHTFPAKALTDTLSRIAAECPGEVGIALIVNNTDTVTVNNRPVYPMMSVFKLHQALAVCHSLDLKGRSLDSVVSIPHRSLNPHTWSPMLKENPRSTITLSIGRLLGYTLKQSDNNASNYMFDNLVGVAETDSFIATIIPRDGFRIALTEDEMSKRHYKSYDNYTSPLAAAILINRLYTDSIVSPQKQAFVRQMLEQCTTGTDRIVAPLLDKKDVIIGHKTGSGYTTPSGILIAHNDVAYVRLPDGTSYALAVFVKDIRGNEALAALFIARISAAVYDALTAPLH